jgi:SAM-dependent methyltransferase
MSQSRGLVLSIRCLSVTAEGHCTLCKSSDVKLLFETPERRYGMGGFFSVVRCSHCGLVRTEPQPSDPGRYYPSGYYSFRLPDPPSRLTRARVMLAGGLEVRSAKERVLARIGAERLTPGLPKGRPGRLLDVGCGAGDYLLALHEAGWTCHGVETSGQACEAATAAGLDVHEGDLVGARFAGESFDVVRFWHSLEHVRSPETDLNEAFRLLVPGGRVLISVPNFASLLSRMTRERWFYLDVPRHLWHFEPATLGRLLRQVGFVEVRTRLMSTSSALLGTIDYLRGRDGDLASKGMLWLGALPIAAMLDGLGVGDTLEATAWKAHDDAGDVKTMRASSAPSPASRQPSASRSTEV